MKYLLCLLSCATFSMAKAQVGTLTEQFCFGASQSEIPVQEVRLTNGNRIILTSSNSPAGNDKSENCRGDYDFWVVCYGPNDQIIWEKTIGGSDIDLASTVLVSSDQSIYIAGGTKSPMSAELLHRIQQG